MKVLLVEDQEHMAYAIEHVFKKNKIIIDLVFDGQDGYSYASTNGYDVIILDIMLPIMDGLKVLNKLRSNNIYTPVILLTAKSELEDKVEGLELGADDYLTKPFEIDELIARVKALARRNKEIISNILEYKNIKLNRDNLLLECENSKYTLTVKEANLLSMFLVKPEIIISKDAIINKLWSYDQVVIDNNVEVYISFLRKKLDTFNTNVVIKTVRGIGYKMIEVSND